MHHIGTGRTRPRSRKRPMASLFHNRWWIVFATICGLVVGAGPINVFTFGVFLKPITEDLGLSRGAFSAALTFTRRSPPSSFPSSVGWSTAGAPDGLCSRASSFMQNAVPTDNFSATKQPCEQQRIGDAEKQFCNRGARAKQKCRAEREHQGWRSVARIRFV